MRTVSGRCVGCRVRLSDRNVGLGLNRSGCRIDASSGKLLGNSYNPISTAQNICVAGQGDRGFQGSVAWLTQPVLGGQQGCNSLALAK